MDETTLPLHTELIKVQEIQGAWLQDQVVTLHVLRLDLIHPIVSGNKWFKLQPYLQEAEKLGKQTVATFGGAYSNHLLAVAFACKTFGLQSVGFIRGEKPEVYSTTLQQAEAYGMQLIFITREQYKLKEAVADEFAHFNWYWIGEGGYGSTGAIGAKSILDFVSENEDYTHIVASVGTGTMLAGLVMAAHPHQKVIGISSMKANTSLEKAVEAILIDDKQHAHFSINHNYHFGGYAKHTPALIDFIQQTYNDYKLPLDIVYTSKLFFAIKDLVGKNHFEKGSKLLMIHSGGLQGNNSLPENAISFM